LCVDLAAAEVAWRYEHEKQHFPFYASPAATNEIVVVAGRDKMVHALNPMTGDLLWIYRDRARLDASPVIVGGRIFVATMDGVLLELNKNTGKPVWEFVAGSSFVASPSVANERLLIGTTDGFLYCFGKKAKE